MKVADIERIMGAFVRTTLNPLVVMVALAGDVADVHAQSGASFPKEGHGAGPSIVNISITRRLRIAWDEKRITGTKAEMSGNTLYFNTGTGRIGIPVDLIDTVWVARNSAPIIALGAVAGAVGLGALGVVAGHHLCESPSGCASDNAKVILLGAGVGAVSGALVGGTVSRLMGRWKRLYP